MAPVIGIVAFLIVLALSLVLTRVATVALAMTGLSHEVAKFQARSAFTGTGFTTREAENVVDHPVRRNPKCGFGDDHFIFDSLVNGT